MQLKPDWSDGVNHLFVITTDDKEALVRHLNENNISPAYHYPVPCHLQKAYHNLGYRKGDFPKAEYLADYCISLPMYAELRDIDLNNIISTLNNYK